MPFHILLVATLLSSFAVTDQNQCSTPTPLLASAAVRALNEQYITAARTNDHAWFRQHMAEDVIVILSSGRRLSKADFLTMVRDEPKKYLSLTVRDATLRVFGATVQVDADAPWQLADGQTGISRYIDTYVWMDCRWQVISAQINQVPKTAEPPGRSTP